MRASQLETFVWLARLGSFKAVADRLNLTQPAITQRISGLEQALGGRLFNREPHGITLTAKGMEILPYAEQHLEAMVQILLRSADPGAHVPTMRLGVVETVAHLWLDTLLQQLHQRFPGLTLELMVDTTAQLHDHLLAGDLDVALLLGPVANPRLSQQWLCSYPLVWVAGADWAHGDEPVSLDTLAQWPIMTYSRRSLPYHLITSMLHPHARGRLRISASSSLATTLMVVRQGRAVSPLPDAVTAPEIAQGTLRILDVSPPLPALEYVAAYPTTSAHPLAATVIDLARHVAGDHTAPG